jgi:hypothetical protein
VNSLVVLTDGKNEDPAGISLDALLRSLSSHYSLVRPVHVVAIAYGRDADPAVLARIAKATDGLVFNSPNPRDIGQVFLTAISAVTS